MLCSVGSHKKDNSTAKGYLHGDLQAAARRRRWLMTLINVGAPNQFGPFYICRIYVPSRVTYARNLALRLSLGIGYGPEPGTGTGTGQQLKDRNRDMLPVHVYILPSHSLPCRFDIWHTTWLHLRDGRGDAFGALISDLVQQIFKLNLPTQISKHYKV